MKAKRGSMWLRFLPLVTFLKSALSSCSSLLTKLWAI